jgi:hypothetical protein
MMIIGFTGAREGMNLKQTKQLLRALKELRPDSIHHGACIGADEQLVRIARKRFQFAVIVAHPSNLKNYQTEWKSDLDYKPCPPLDRNKDIVTMCDILIAAPKSNAEELRSGTWATIRYARKMKKPIIFLER